MQIELTLHAPPGSDYSARDLGFLLHKHPDQMHIRTTAQGEVFIFFPQVSDTSTQAVIHLEVDPIALVRGKNKHSDGPLGQYVNDRPYAANSFLSVALTRAIGQTMSGKSKERQALADRALPYCVRVTPVAVAGGAEVIDALFSPLGYEIRAKPLSDAGFRTIYDLHLSATVRLAELLNHIYVLVPVLDNAKHYWIDREEIEKLLAKGGDWLPFHPAKELITNRALKHRKGLVVRALDRLSESLPGEPESDAPPQEQEETLEKPIRLHDLRLDAVRAVLIENQVRSVLDLGCGEGKLLGRLIKERGFERIVGVDPSVRSLENAVRRLRLENAGETMRKRVQLQMGSLTYGDRRWQGFDAATLVEVIEHVDPPRLSALELSVFGDARPRIVIVTTPNREYNALFEGLVDGSLRHRDHRFEWTREEFRDWVSSVAETYGYDSTILPLGPLDETRGAPSQMAVFVKETAA